MSNITETIQYQRWSHEVVRMSPLYSDSVLLYDPHLCPAARPTSTRKHQMELVPYITQVVGNKMTLDFAAAAATGGCHLGGGEESLDVKTCRVVHFYFLHRWDSHASAREWSRLPWRGVSEPRLF